MRKGDILFTNVVVQSGDKVAELDNIVVNRYGVFVIEAKNYHGFLQGMENDNTWMKTKTTGSGNQYVKMVRNPIRQVKREVFVLKSYIKEHGINVWIDGYVILTEFNSPVASDYILTNYDDIDNAIHRDTEMLSKNRVRRVKEIFANESYIEMAS